MIPPPQPFVFGYFPRHKYKDLVFYVKDQNDMNFGLFEMEDTPENRGLMEALSTHPAPSEQESRTIQCKNCIRDGLRDCMYHGYPEDTIPRSCAYKIGNEAVNTVYDVPVIKRNKQGAP